MQVQINNLELSAGWTENVGSTINPVAPSGYAPVQTAGQLRLYCCGAAYAGWLAKFVNPLWSLFTTISLQYALSIDDCTAEVAQVIETDTKVTDSAGWTYDLSAQFNIAEGWMFQIGNPWKDTGIIVSPPASNVWTPVQIDYALNYAARTSSVLAVTVAGKKYLVPTTMQNVPAGQVGWTPNQIVTQLQQCIGAQSSAYSVAFKNINYLLSM